MVSRVPIEQMVCWAYRANLLGGTSLGNGQTDTEDGVGSKLGLVWSSVEVDQELVNGGLVLDVEVRLNDSGGDGLDHVLDGLGDTLAAPLRLVTVAELAGLMLTYCRPTSASGSSISD